LPATGPARLQACHQAGLQSLYTEHHGWLHAWLRHKLGNSFDAADLAHDTFIRVLGKPRELATLREPRAWLSSIAHGLVVDRVRRLEVERACMEAIAQLPGPEMMSPEDRMMLTEALVAIDAMLDGLGARARQAFLLSRLEDMSYAEIAAHMAVSLSSVEKYMAAAIRHCYTMRRALLQSR
jgi:RNA polymerase sigma-70 factor (ECF subfamily)